MENIIKNTQKHKVEVRIEGAFLNLFIKRLSNLNINISNILYMSDNQLSFITNYDNISKLKENFKDYKITIKKNKGIYNILPLMKKNRIFLISLLIGLITFIFLQNIIVQVDVIHSDKKIRELVTDELEEYGIKRLTFKKSYKEIEIIKKKILDKYPDDLEWIEIENIGMTYKVRIEQRLLTKIKKDSDYCNIVATKSGIITKVISKDGMILKNSKDYAAEGDVIIAGDIKVEDEIKKSVCAKGQVFSEVWYTVNVSVPYNYQEKDRTGKSRINFMYDNSKEKKTILRSFFDNKEVKNTKIFSLLGTTFYFQKEYELEVKNKKYSQNEAINRALELSKEKLKLKLSDNERIITQKVLKTTPKDSKMDVEIFVSVEEEVGKTEHYTLPENTETLE